MNQLNDFSSILRHWEAQQPRATAIRFGNIQHSWAALANRVQRIAAALRAAGLAPGERIAVLDLNHPSCLELTLACAQVGTANAVVNFRLTPPEIAYVINDAKARLLFVGPEFADAIDKLREQLPSIEQVIRIGGDNDQYEAWLAAHEPDARVHAAGPGDCFLQLYTSGTTGFPKGAMLTQRGMLAHGRNIAALQPMGPDARVQVAMPLFHVGGTSYGACCHRLRCTPLHNAHPGSGSCAGHARRRGDHAHLLRACVDGRDEPGARGSRSRLLQPAGAVLWRVADAAAGDAGLRSSFSRG
jgi:acyl-CoA synthetase (AMP-forming)/AMP-acid ligase II